MLQQKLQQEFSVEKANFLDGGEGGLGGEIGTDGRVERCQEVGGNKFDLDPNQYGYEGMRREVENSAFNILKEVNDGGGGSRDPREFFDSAFQEPKVSGEVDYMELIRKNNHGSAQEFLGGNSSGGIFANKNLENYDPNPGQAYPGTNHLGIEQRNPHANKETSEGYMELSSIRKGKDHSSPQSGHQVDFSPQKHSNSLEDSKWKTKY